MAETLTALLLITSSGSGSTNLIFRWPQHPSVSARYGRPKGLDFELDNPWSASNIKRTPPSSGPVINEDDYLWKRASNRDRSVSMTSDRPGSPSNRRNEADEPFDDILGFTSEFLAGLLCPQRASLCHQRFELVVDDLAFLGHPVCADVDGEWRFRPDPSKHRGRDARTKSQRDFSSSFAGTPPGSPGFPPESSGGNSSCQTFQLVAVLDLPDPSSSASGNVRRYFDLVYQEVVFPVTAVLFREQVLSNFVQTECDQLVTLKDKYHSKGETFSSFMSEALRTSSIARAMKTVYEAVKSRNVAEIIINNLPVEIQLPPHLDELLHNEDDVYGDDVKHTNDEEDGIPWGPVMSVGWRLLSLAPWKSLLLLDDPKGPNPVPTLPVDPADAIIAEKLMKFLEIASVTLSFSDMASLLDWHLSHIYDTVRWLVHHRRAKVVDIVHPNLKTVFSLPQKFNAPILTLAREFKDHFPSPMITSLPDILSAISTSTAQQRDNHFFATVVRSKDMIQHYHEVVVWMLKREMLVTLHLRIRIVATADLKQEVRNTRLKKEQERFARKQGNQGGSHLRRDGDYSRQSHTVSMSPKSARKYSRQMSKSSMDSGESRRRIKGLIGSSIMEDETDDSVTEDYDYDDLDEEDESSDGEEELEEGDAETFRRHSMISDPVSASPLQRRWLQAMSAGKPLFIAAKFQQINQWFDGRKTDDEILFREDISRKELREILHHYDKYLQTFLHP